MTADAFRLFAELFEHNRDGVILSTPDGKLARANAAACALAALAENELLAHQLVDLFSDDEGTLFVDMRAPLVVGATQTCTCHLRRANGAALPVEVTAKTLADGSRLVFLHDLSERLALRASEAKLQGLVDAAADAIVVVDAAQNIVLYNQAAERIFGWTKSEILGRPHDLLVPERLRAKHAGLVRDFGKVPRAKRRMGQRGATIFGLRKDGSEFPSDAAVSTFDAGGERLFAVVMRDVTEQRQVEAERQQLSESLAEERGVLQTVLDNVQTGILAFDECGDITTINARLVEILGLDPRLDFPASWAKLAHRTDGSPMPAAEWPSRRALRGEVVSGAEIRIERPTGEVLELHGGAAPIRDSKGAIVGVVAHLDDITEVRKRERRLAFLAQAGETLTSKRGSREVIDALLTMCVPEIGDACIVTLREDERLTLHNRTSADEDRRRALEELVAEYPGGSTRGALAVMASKETVHLPRVDSDVRRAVAKDARQAELLERLGPTSFVAVPLIAKDVPLGSMSIMIAGTARTLDAADARMIEGLARVLALTLQNDRLLDQAERDRARLESAIESMDDAVAFFDDQERLAHCNDMFRLLMASLGREERVLGVSYEELLDPVKPRPGSPDDGPRSRASTAPHNVTNLRTESGRSLRLLQRRTPSGRVLTIWDLTDDARREDELRDARVAAESASAAKSEFLASMSHELRTPLNAVLGFAQLLQRDRIDPLSQRHKDRVAQIQKGGEHLLHLVEDVLDLARIEARGVALRPEHVDVGQVLREALRTLEPMTQAQGITLSIAGRLDDLPAVDADRTRFSQIILNFGSNAIKYNRPGGTVTFSASMRSPGRLRVTVTDTGTGIRKDKVARLFQPFERAGQETGAIQGTGIGLVICERLARSMGGDVGFQSEPGVGSEFWVDLPASPSNSAVRGSSNGRAERTVLDVTSGPPRVVLYVEDDPASGALIVDALSSPHLRLFVERCAKAGIRRARELRPSAILLDVNLPDMSGFDARRVLSELEETRGIPVIALTAAATTVPPGAKTGDFFAYLTKPVDLVELEGALARALAPVS